MKTFLLFVVLICATTTASPTANGNGESLSGFQTSLKQTLDTLLALVQRMPTCGCDVTGSSSLQCAVSTDLCTCKAGYKGNKCEAACGCDNTGSISTACDQASGQCSCNTGYTGRTCNSCATSYFRTNGGACKQFAQRVVAKVLVVSGWKGGDYRWKPEIWPRPKTQCALPDYPLRVVGAVGFMTALGPVVCDGKCLVYQQHQWMPFSNLIYDRRYASAIEVSSHQALIIGGIDENVNFLKTTERISSSGSEERNNFPVSINSHCSFKYNATHAMVTAGRQDGRSVSANTWYVDLNTTRVTPGPTMKTKREGHGCATFQYGTKSYGIVAGGYNYVRLDSTEMIELGQESPTWTEGPKLPRRLEDLTLAKTSEGTYAMGGKDWDSNFRTEVLQLDCPGDQISSCLWTKVGNLQFARAGHVAIPIPESSDICN